MVVVEEVGLVVAAAIHGCNCPRAESVSGSDVCQLALPLRSERCYACMPRTCTVLVLNCASYCTMPPGLGFQVTSTLTQRRPSGSGNLRMTIVSLQHCSSLMSRRQFIMASHVMCSFVYRVPCYH